MEKVYVTSHCLNGEPVEVRTWTILDIALDMMKFYVKMRSEGVNIHATLVKIENCACEVMQVV